MEILGPLRIFSSYGLFRQMTGVGKYNPISRENIDTDKPPFIPSIVTRPEIVIEGFKTSTNEWIEINFKHKPTNLFQSPTFIAPHQPRLDWQMWFAALGTHAISHEIYHYMQIDRSCT